MTMEALNVVLSIVGNVAVVLIAWAIIKRK